MKKIVEYLYKLGFSEIEAKIYLLLLKSGSLTVAELAEKAKINRTAAYSHINNLLEKGIIAKVKGSTNKIVANPPESLQVLVEQRITEASKLKESFPSLVNALYSTLSTEKEVPSSEMRYYKGRAGVKSIYEEVLKSDKIRAYFDPIALDEVFPENSDLFELVLEKNKNLVVYEIVEDSPFARREYERDKGTKRHPWKFLPADIKLTANDILIYDGKVAIINIGDKDNVSGVVLENRDYYNNSVQLFDLLWRLLPEQK